MASKPKEVGPGEAARRLGVAIGTLANWRNQGFGPPWRKHRPHRNAAITYHLREVIQWGQRNGYIAKEARQ